MQSLTYKSRHLSEDFIEKSMYSTLSQSERKKEN